MDDPARDPRFEDVVSSAEIEAAIGQPSPRVPAKSEKRNPRPPCEYNGLRALGNSFDRNSKVLPGPLDGGWSLARRTHAH